MTASGEFDHLAFSTAEKRRRYDTARYRGAVGRNWWTCDPSLQGHVARRLGPAALAWADPHLSDAGTLMGGPIARWAEETDRHPPRLERYDRWGHDVSEVVQPATFVSSRDAVVASSFSRPSFRDAAREAGVDTAPLTTASSYLLDQADIGMACALGTGAGMVVRLAEAFAPRDVRDRVRAIFADGESSGAAAQMLTERTGGSDLAMLETTATPVSDGGGDSDGDAWRLNGLKWFASNAGGEAFVVLAKPEGAADSTRGIAPFLVLRERRDGSRNGVHIRRLKDKLGTRSVASGEVEFVDAEAFLLSGTARDGAGGEGVAGDGRGLSRMMEMTNGARLGIAMMGLGCARRSLLEALCYATAREAFGAPLADQPLMQRTLAELIVEVEAAQALVFDGYLGTRGLRLGAPLIKLRAARLGVTAASTAIEVHGGNGYIEQWPVARILRDAQVNTIWEGPDNILCLDVRRSIEREAAHEALVARMRDAVGAAPAGDDTAPVVADAIDDVEAAVKAWQSLPRATAEARLWELSHLLVDVYAASLLVEHAGWERSERGTDRGALVAALYVRSHLSPRSRLDMLTTPPLEIDRFKELLDGAFVDEPTA